MKRRPMTGIGKGMNAFFEKTEAEKDPRRQLVDKAVSQHTDIQTKRQASPVLERATFYIRPAQHTTLEKLKIKLRKHKVKTNKSELLRTAIDLLAERDLQLLANRLTNK